MVTSNHTLKKLKKYTVLGKTPVVLVENIDWIKRAEWHQNRNNTNRIIQSWKTTWESLDPHDFISQHSIDFESKKHNFEEGHAVYEVISDDHHDHMVSLDDGTIYEFNDDLIEQRQKEIAQERGFELVEHSMVLYVKPIKK